MKYLILTFFCFGFVLGNTPNLMPKDLNLSSLNTSSLFVKNSKKKVKKYDPLGGIISFSINPEIILFIDTRLADSIFPYYLTNSFSYRTRLSIDKNTRLGKGHKFSCTVNTMFFFPLSILHMAFCSTKLEDRVNIPLIEIGYQNLSYRNPKGSSSTYYGVGVKGAFLCCDSPHYNRYSQTLPFLIGNLTCGKEFSRKSSIATFTEFQINYCIGFQKDAIYQGIYPRISGGWSF